MGAPEPEKSVHDRLSEALERLEKLTGPTDHHDAGHGDPKTVEEAVERLKHKVDEKGAGER